MQYHGISSDYLATLRQLSFLTQITQQPQFKVYIFRYTVNKHKNFRSYVIELCQWIEESKFIYYIALPIGRKIKIYMLQMLSQQAQKPEFIALLVGRGSRVHMSHYSMSKKRNQNSCFIMPHQQVEERKFITLVTGREIRVHTLHYPASKQRNQILYITLGMLGCMSFFDKKQLFEEVQLF